MQDRWFEMSNTTKIIVVLSLAALLFFAYSTAQDSGTQGNDYGSSMQVTVTYTDGSQQVFHSGNYPIGMTIVDPSTGKTVSSIKVEVYVTPVYTGTIQSYSVSGTFRMKITDGTQAVYDTGSVNIQPISPLPKLTSGAPVVITSSTVSASTIESLYGQWQHGKTYTMSWAVESFTMSATFSDGKTQSRSAQPIGMSWSFRYESPATLSSVSLSFYNTLS